MSYNFLSKEELPALKINIQNPGFYFSENTDHRHMFEIGNNQIGQTTYIICVFGVFFFLFWLVGDYECVRVRACVCVNAFIF